MAGAGSEGPSVWVVALFCAVMIAVTIFVCGLIFLLCFLVDQIPLIIDQWLILRQKKALLRALEAELTVTAFFLILLYCGENYSFPAKTVSAMLPSCLKNEQEEFGIATMDSNFKYSSSCPNAKVPLVSSDVPHQLDMFVLFFILVHVACNFLTITLGKAKICGWKEWEKEALSPSSKFSSDPPRFRLPLETTFLKQHTMFWNTNPIILYIASFFCQFLKSVSKTEYLTLRHGFLTGHLAPGSEFNFHEYINRSLEDDFKTIVGVSPVFWVFRVLLVILNVTGSQMFWFLLIPLSTILAVGTKLEAIIGKLVVEILVKHKMIRGVPSIQPNDRHFWFGCPDLILVLIHFTLFQNAFEVVHFIWIWCVFGFESCFHYSFKHIAVRLCLGIAVQFLCSYVALPLYVLVCQMGSNTKEDILKDILDSKETV